MKQATAKLKNLKIAPRKVRLVADLIKGMPVNAAVAQLQITRLRSSEDLEKLLRSAMANAKSAGLNTDKLVVKSITVDKGMMLKRYLPRARGQATEIQKKFSHVNLILEESAEAKSPSYVIREQPKKVKKEDSKKPKAKAPVEKPVEEKTQKPAPKSPGIFKKVFNRKAI